MSRGAPYRADLAHVHHAGFGDFARRAAPGLFALLRRAGVHDGLILDLGCGSGIWLAAAARAGYATAGLDASRSMIALARRTAPAARLRVGSIHEAALPRCDAVTAIGEVLSYVPSGRARPPALAPLFARVARALRPGGLFVFDLFMTGRGRPVRYDAWRAGGDWAVLIRVAEDRRRGRLVRDITTFRRVGRTYRRADERHVLALAERACVERALRRAGFTVRVVRRYGNLAMLPRRLAFLARRD
jgi:SAM-dependent methyltransferase